ncbi:MAG: serine kinase [Marinosulfonomonas sp.]|nr:serine kinase [Marinosulfonomonas sp.]
MSDPLRETITIHASCVGYGPAAAMFIGPSGSGKSGLALEMMALGALLIADDQTNITRTDIGLQVSCPDAIRGRIEAWGVGILAAETQAMAMLRVVVDLSKQEDHRLPPARTTVILGQVLPLLHTPVRGHSPAAILQYLKGGRTD